MTDNPYEPGGAEQLDQLQPDDTLIDRGVADVLDEGYIAPDGWSVLETYGNTAAEMRQGESIDRQLAAELPDAPKEQARWRPEPGQAESVGGRRAGRLVALSGGLGDEAIPDTLATDVGIDGGAATAEEAAMHIIDPEAGDDLDDED
ncbi:MAG: DUF5709 domain-containing protein [Propionibacteriaceae bacterium]|jgi:hypothetical protein|nr:DUF5709 domain-containing protein [Propionibacteriaceae bacterium]